MSIIYSYPTVQPTVEDLLIGTDVGQDNATKSFTVQSLVSLINAAAGSGTVTRVEIATDYSLSATGGPITDAGVITMGLATTGTPSTNTFLGYSALGQLEWRTPTVSAGIEVYYQTVEIANDLSTMNFVGEGVTATGDGIGNTTIRIDGTDSAIETVDGGAGISVNSTTGNVIVTNTGVTSIAGGTNISLTNNLTTGAVEINSNGGGNGSVTSVNAGVGLTVSSGSPLLDPTLAIDYTGGNNFIRLGADPTVAVADDFILFEQVSTGDVKSTTFGSIATSALTLVDTAIAASQTNVIRNELATNPLQSYSSFPPVNNIVTLTDQEYIDLGTAGTIQGNTLYLTSTTAVPNFTVTLATINNSIPNQGSQWQYNASYDVLNATRSGATGDSYQFDTRLQALNGYTFSGLSIQNAIGQIGSADADVTTTITGSMNAPYVPGNATISLSGGAPDIQFSSNPDNATVANGAYNLNFTPSFQVSSPYSWNSSSFNVSMAIATTNTWEFTAGPNISFQPASGTSSDSGSVSVPCTIDVGIRKKTYQFTYTVTDSNTGGTIVTDYNIATSTSSAGVTFVSGANGSGTVTAKVGTTFTLDTVLTQVGSKITTSNTPITTSYTIGTADSAATVIMTSSTSSGTGVVQAGSFSDTQFIEPAGATSTYLLQSRITNAANTSIGPWLYTSTATGSIGDVVDWRYVLTPDPAFTVQQAMAISYAGASYGNQQIFASFTFAQGTQTLQPIVLTGKLIVPLGSANRSNTASPNTVCGLTTRPFVYYYDSVDDYPTNGSILYINNTGTAFLPSGHYQTYIQGGANGYVSVTTNGVVDFVSPCIGGAV
tara:strand:+ start:54 stop:2543 length:2490 start_codon:yes stop_codon:yes gene_type:complete